MLSDSESAELLESFFLKPDTRPDLKGHATEYILGLSGNGDGCRFLRNKPDMVVATVSLMSDPSFAIAKDCYHAVINLSADPTLHELLVKRCDLLPLLFRNLVDPTFQLSDKICTILSNLSRHKNTCKPVLKMLEEEETMGFPKLVEIFCTKDFNKTASLHYLGPLLSNLTQLPEARRFILDRDRCVIQRLLPYTQFEASTVRRGGVIGCLRNCSFDHTHHEWLLSDAVDILPFLLLPLAGPEELTDKENEGLPVDLQYLSEDKTREPDPDIRKMLVETLLLLTATKAGRQLLQDKNVYPIMREFHRWEKEPRIGVVCEKLIQVLIGDEPEEGMENLMEVKIPDDVAEKLKEADCREEEEVKKEEEELRKEKEEEVKKEEEEMRKEKEERRTEEEERRTEEKEEERKLSEWARRDTNGAGLIP